MPTDFVSTSESLEALEEAIAAGLELLEPPAEMTVSEWADKFAYLPRESSAQPGKWHTSVAEYQRELMDAGSDPGIERIVAMWGAQLGKTACLLNMLWYYAHHDPSPMLMVQPTIETAEAFSKERIAPSIRDTPVLSPLFGDPRSRDSGNTLLTKEFPGGGLALAGANSPAGLASRSRRVVMGDEVDKWEASAGAEGDPGKLMVERTNTFWNRKIVYTSTPSIKGASRIEHEFEKSDKRKYFVRCPHCGDEQALEWGNLQWRKVRDGKKVEHFAEECWYACGVSGCEILESEKPEMVRSGRWIATAKSIDGRTAGFHLNALYSPWVTWPELIRKWLDAQGSSTELQTFVNASLAETWEVQGDRVEQSVFADRIHPYAAEVPEGVLVITGAVDVQKDRLEATAIGWGVGEESWAIEHVVFQGDPSRPEVWSELDSWLGREYQHESGIRLRIRCAMIDSGGHHTKQVYAFTKAREHRRVYACKGRAGSYPLLARPTKQGTMEALLYMVGVDAAKELFYARLKIEQEGPGYCHFPDNPDVFDEEYFAQITAEQLVTVRRNGQDVRVWQKRRARNEALDLRVYAMAALERIRANFPALRKSLTRRLVKGSPPLTVAEQFSENQAKVVEYMEEEQVKREQTTAEQDAVRQAAEIEARRNQRELERLNRRGKRGGWVRGRW